jgi:regulator of sigma E protease
MSEFFTLLRFGGTLLLVLLVFNFIILVHEWGHFLAARWRGLKVEKFQIWMGEPIWKRTWNGVQYGLGWLPLGGFVALPQMAPMEAIEGRTDPVGEVLPPIKPLDKILVAFAGPLFSAALALVFALLVSFFGKPQHPSDRTTTIGYKVPGMAAAQSELQPGDRILQIDGRKVSSFMGIHGSVAWAVASSQHNPIDFLVQRPGEPSERLVKVEASMSSDPDYVAWEAKTWWQKALGRPPLRRVGIGPELNWQIDKVIAGSPAEAAGLQVGDILTAMNGQKLYASANALELQAERSEGQAIALTYRRGDQEAETSLIPRKPIAPKDLKASTGLGYKLADADTVVMDHPNPFQLVYAAGANTVSTLVALFSPKSEIKASHMNGPVGILHQYYNIIQSEHAFRLVLYFSVILNISLALFNLLPLPVLDGGHITLGFLEMIRGKAANLKVLEYLQLACVMMLLCFVVFVSLKDVGGLANGGGNGKPEEVKFGPSPAASPVLGPIKP